MIIVRLKLVALIYLGLLFLTSSCLSIGPTTSKGRGKYYESFFVGEQGMQYFFKPLKFKNESGENLILDLSFRHKEDFIDSATVNFSFLSDEVYRDLVNLQISSPGGTVSLKITELLFVEKDDRSIESRYTAKADPAALSRIFEESDWEIEASFDDKNLVFEPTRKTEKGISVLYADIFSILLK